MLQLIRYLIRRRVEYICCAVQGHPAHVYCGRRWKGEGFDDFDHVPIEDCECGRSHVRYPLCGGHRAFAEYEKEDYEEEL